MMLHHAPGQLIVGWLMNIYHQIIGSGNELKMLHEYGASSLIIHQMIISVGSASQLLRPVNLHDAPQMSCDTVAIIKCKSSEGQVCSYLVISSGLV